MVVNTDIFPTRRINTKQSITVTFTFPTTQNLTRKHYNFLSQSFQPKTLSQDFQHRRKNLFVLPFKLREKCTVWIFIKHESQHGTQHTHTHTHTEYKKWNATLAFFGEQSSLPSRCLTISVQKRIKNDINSPQGAKKVFRVTKKCSS
jgi:PhoPQ-activated pathogenicity-related protein